MHSSRDPRSILILFAAGIVLSACSYSARAQEAASSAGAATPAPPAGIPDAPEPQIEVATSLDPQTPQTQGNQPPSSESAPAQNDAGQSQSAQPLATPADPSAAAGSPSKDGVTQARQPNAQETQRQKAQEQLNQEETQRVAGIMSTFNTTRNPDALPLSPGQKFQLFFKSASDPWAFGLNAVVAGVNQAADSEPEWGQGMQGYAKRFGAGYSDYFIGNFFGNAVLPSLLHEDPRYFQKGSGSFMRRFLWAAASTGWSKRDGGGWGPNWANVGGNLIGAAISRTYYPASERTVADTIDDGLTVSAEGIVGAEVIEFWPDMVRHHQRKKAEKQARAMGAAAKQKKPQGQSQSHQE